MSQFKIIGLIIGFCWCSGMHLQAQLLWKIEHDDAKKPSYLYGTIHVSDQRVFQFQDSVLAKFYEVDVFAGEMVFDYSVGMTIETISFMMMPNDTTIADLLPKDKFEKVYESMKREFGFMASYMMKVKPILVANMFTEQRVGQKKVTSNTMILDLYFQQLAKKKNKELIGLETFEEQAEALDGISLKMQADMLYEQITSKGSPKDGYEELLQLYLDQDLNRLYEYTLSQMDTNVNKTLLINRNIKMAKRADKMMKNKSLFIGIGAAHLPGKSGVIQLLRNLGYTVMPVQNPSKNK